VTVYWPTKKIYITPGDFSKVSPFHPSNYVLARALAMGDSSDNIKGLKGLGEKTLLKIYPTLTICPTSFDHMLEVIRMRLELQDKGELKLTASEKRWFPVILESAELVRTNLQVMQLTSPVISAYSGAVINSAVASTPEFNVTKFKLALINAGIQLTDQDLFTTFQEYRMRATNANV
jgi:5'-3' exonuclease